MNVDRMVLSFAGLMIVVSVALALLVSQWFLALTVFVGVNLFQSAFTGFCPLAILLKKAGVNSGAAFT